MRLCGSTFGPTTRDFGLQFHVKWQELEAIFEAVFSVGRGNNASELGNFPFKFPPDFGKRTVLEAFLLLVEAAISDGIELYRLSYVDDSRRHRYMDTLRPKMSP